MKIVAFRIRSFRSVIDSGWVKFSNDFVTAFVGQNESGKTTILHALHVALSTEDLDPDDLRIESNMPSVDLRVALNFSEIAHKVISSDGDQQKILQQYFTDADNLLEIRIGWENAVIKGRRETRKIFTMTTQTLHKKLTDSIPKVSVASGVIDVWSALDPAKKKQLDEAKKLLPQKLNSNDVAGYIWDELPLGVLFRDTQSELPSFVDIDADGKPTGAGSEAANFFLKIAALDLKTVLTKDKRTLAGILRSANAKVTADFRQFWTQTIGNDERLSIKIDIDHYSHSDSERAGRPHIVFWILDGNTQLYPRQRSQGVRWFISFYLQLKASEIDGLDRIFLLDEPGANLHTRAQIDVLRLINQLSTPNSSVVYTTHSPNLIEYEKLYRVRAVQRSAAVEGSPTNIIDAHQLGTAARDTLSPILMAMGTDLHKQQVIQKDNNVLLEEMSGFYYMTAFWKLTAQKKSAYFIATTGVNKIEALANMFIGWGLDFIVAMDDDRQGRDAYNSMKLRLFGDDEKLAREKMLRIPNCPAIEDAFSISDFTRYVLNEPALELSGRAGEFLRTSNHSKPVLAFRFAQLVDKGAVTFANFDPATQLNLTEITSEIASRLKDREN